MSANSEEEKGEREKQRGNNQKERSRKLVRNVEQTNGTAGQLSKKKQLTNEGKVREEGNELQNIQKDVRDNGKKS